MVHRHTTNETTGGGECNLFRLGASLGPCCWVDLLGGAVEICAMACFEQFASQSIKAHNCFSKVRQTSPRSFEEVPISWQRVQIPLNLPKENCYRRLGSRIQPLPGHGASGWSSSTVGAPPDMTREEAGGPRVKMLRELSKGLVPSIQQTWKWNMGPKGRLFSSKNRPCSTSMLRTGTGFLSNKMFGHIGP